LCYRSRPYHAAGWWWWDDPDCYIHNIFSEEDQYCAWSEGWADFLPLPVNNDECYDLGPDHCGDHGGVTYNLEWQNWDDGYPWGDGVEGRVAGSLYGIFDDNNEGYDSATFGFAPIADIVFNGTNVVDLDWFWINWSVSHQSNHNAVRALFQNTIDYDGAPIFYPELPDKTIFVNGHGAIDLWFYSYDYESLDEELTFEITYNPNPQCGISLENNRWIDIAPQPNWLGTCEAIIQVSDSLKTNNDIFLVNVIVPVDTEFLPIISLMSNP
jgi:hypothetical protein